MACHVTLIKAFQTSYVVKSNQRSEEDEGEGDITAELRRIRVVCDDVVWTQRR